MKKLVCIFIIFTVINGLLSACAAKPKVDYSAQLEKDGYDFLKQLQELIKLESDISYTGDIPLSKAMPKNVMIEVTDSRADRFQIGLAVPVSKKASTGLEILQQTKDFTYFGRAGYLDPNTDFYIVPVFTGTPPGNALYESGPPSYKIYPKRASIGFFDRNIIIESPYYIPENASWGVYALSWTAFIHDRRYYEMSGILRDLLDSNPYKAKVGVEKYDFPVFEKKLLEFQIQLGQAEKDLIVAKYFIDYLDNKFFAPGMDSPDDRSAVVQYKKQVDAMLQRIGNMQPKLETLQLWDFESIARYTAGNNK
jgi:hypothetical protein